MNFNTNELKQVCREKGLSYELYELIDNILSRVDNPNDDEDILQAIDDELIYYDDQWLVIKEYCFPQEANWNNSIDQFIQDIFSISATIQWRN